MDAQNLKNKFDELKNKGRLLQAELQDNPGRVNEISVALESLEIEAIELLSEFLPEGKA